MKKVIDKDFKVGILIIIFIVVLVGVVKLSIYHSPPELTTSGKGFIDDGRYFDSISHQEIEQNQALSLGNIYGCSDKDNGFYVNKKGEVYGFKDSDLFDYQDSCIDANILEEYVCIGDYYDSVEVECIRLGYNFCFKGECI